MRGASHALAALALGAAACATPSAHARLSQMLPDDWRAFCCVETANCKDHAVTLAPGGRLLYVTCSVLSAENEAVVADFLAAQDDACEDKVLHDYNIRALMCERRAGFQVLPGTQGLDGFYFAALEKKASS